MLLLHLTVNANVTGQVSDISGRDTGDLTTNQYFTQARARESVSVTHQVVMDH